MIALKEKSHSIKDYKLLPEGAPYQLIERELVMTPAPNPRHQIISANLFKTISKYVDEREEGIVLYSPVDIYLDNENVYQPDIVFIPKQRQEIIKDDGICGAPDLVVEILSPSTAYYDLRKKFRVYEKYGVREYWIVDPGMGSVEVYFHEKGSFSLTGKAEGKGEVESTILKGFKMTLNEVFSRM